VSACTQRGVVVQRGSWEIAYASQWSWKAHRRLWQYSLYQSRAGQRVFIADHIRGYYFYPDDCIIFHASSPQPEGYFAACGARRPLRISRPDDQWRKLGDTFQELEVRNGQIVVIQRREIAELLALAKAQPLSADTGVASESAGDIGNATVQGHR
jgi:hypothetical protein